MSNNPKARRSESITAKWKARSKLLVVCALVSYLGCAAVVAADIIGIIVVEKHNPISETISTLAIGKQAWIQDVGIDAFAAAVFACGAGMLIWRAAGIRWMFCAILLIVLAGDLVLIAEHNQYAGQPTPEGAIHRQLTFVLYIIVSLTTLLLAFDLRRFGRGWFWGSLSAFAVWLILCPVFLYVVPTSWDGALERFLGLILVLWVAMISTALLQKARGRLRTAA
jgi:hypothetical protein